MTSFKPWIILFFLPFAASLLAGPHVLAQAPDRIAQGFDPAQVQVLANHHPEWANPANDLGVVPANQPLENLTFVLARSDEQELAFDQLLADQLDPVSQDFHRWLTPQEIGQRFGISDNDISAITAWLQSQGLHVNWISQSRILISFGGTAADMGRAFQTEFHNYKVNDKQRVSVASDPVIPSALAPLIKAVRGFYTVEDHAFHLASPAISDQPGMTITSGGVAYHFIAPADFSLIYDLPAAQNGNGTTIGIVGEARTDMADYVNFKSLTNTTFSNPTEVIPALQGGADPGSAYTAVPACAVPTNTCASSVNQLIDAQSEAELDVTRAGTVAPGASILLVTATAASGGIAADTEYLVDTSPVPAQVISISFGACETAAGSGNVMFWDSLFKLAAGEGISVFVASGDAGASECDSYFTTPPAVPQPNSPNYICSSSYATCVGGTEFADTANPSLYWSSTSSPTNQLSALSYIPEGAWNEPLVSGGGTEAAATGGGVSVFIATPSWQTGNGVPPARLGRYTPDVAFPAAGHDGYLGCFAAGGGSCVSGSGGTPFEIFGGTSAAAPSMSGVAALLDQKLGSAQGNLNPETYQMAANSPGAFHAVSIATSGVTNCSLTTPSMCNNSIPSPTGLTGGQAGFSLGATGGYSEVTGLGSPDVTQFINNYSNTVSTITPTVTITVPPQSISATQAVLISVTVSGPTGDPAPTGTVTLNSGTYSSGPVMLNTVSGANDSVVMTIAAGSLAVGTDTLTAAYTSTSGTYNNASGTNTITVTSSTKTTPTITWANPTAISYGTALSATQLNATANVPGTFVYTPAAGAVLTVGSQTIRVNFTPNDTTDYNNASDSVTLTVNQVAPVITWPTPAAITFGTALSSTQLDATANTAGSFVYSPTVGLVLTAGPRALMVTFTPNDGTDYTTASDTVILTVNKATPTISWQTPAAVAAGTALSSTQLDATASVPGTYVYNPTIGTVESSAGNVTLNVTFTPTDNTDYNTLTDSVTLVVTSSGNAGFSISGTSVSFTAGATSGNASTITVAPSSGGFTGVVTLSAVVTSSPPAGSNFPPTFSWAPSSAQVNLSGTTNGTATLTIATTAPTSGSCTSENLPQRGLPWYPGGAALACVILLGIPAKRRKLQTFLGLLALCFALGAGVAACGGNNNTKACPAIATAGTTTGPYTITITGTPQSGAAQMGTVSLTVN
jgi:hypothetical protein